MLKLYRLQEQLACIDAHIHILQDMPKTQAKDLKGLKALRRNVCREISRLESEAGVA